jgi:O-antigen ligase
MAQAGPIQNMNVGQEKGEGRRAARLDHLLWLLIALSPLIFAITSWNPFGAAGRLPDYVLSYSVPITFVELVAIVFAILAGFKPAATIREAPRWAQLALGIVIAIAVYTAAFAAPDRATALVRTYASAVHLLFGFSLYWLMQARWIGLRSLVWPSIVAGACLYLLAVVAYVIAVQDDPGFNWKRFGLGVSHIRQTGFYSVVGASAALGLAAMAQGRIRYWTAVAAAALMLSLSYWSGTRGSPFALLAAFGAALVMLPAMRSWRAIGALLVANLGGILLSLIYRPPNSFYGVERISQSAAAATGADEIATGRLTMWIGTVRVALERPLFGHGESQFRGIVPEALGEFNHPHNILMQVLLQWGIVGFVCFFSLAAFLGWRFVQAARKGGGDMMPAFLVAGGLVTMSLYEGTLYHPYPIMMLVVSIAFVLSSTSTAPHVIASGTTDGIQPA